MPASCSQVPIGSLHDWTSKVQLPSVSAHTVAAIRETCPSTSCIRTGGRRAPLGSVSTTSAPELVVTLAEHERGDVEGLADGGLRWMAPEVDDGCHVHDGDASDHAPQTCEVRPFTQTGVPVMGPP